MRLTDCFVDLVAYVAYFLKSAADRQPAFEQVKADIQRLISDSERGLDRGDFSVEDYDMARFAIFAWIDEAILASGWNERNRWQGEQLQRIYYKTTNAGEIFFDRLNAIGHHQRDVREVYYLCLAMGFSGRYCHEGDEFLLEQVKISNLKMLTGSSMGVPSIEKGDLFPEAYPYGEIDVSLQKGGRRFSPFTIFCVGLPVAIFLLLFIIYWFILGNIGENLLSAVQK
jgi:type VI secretion system protein ImpK